MNVRSLILHAVYEAERLHQQFETAARVASGEGRIDVFEIFVARDLPLMFRPLTNLLGAYVNTPDEGVLVTSRRPLAVQRFTAAHELGHSVLGHEPSFDNEEILTRAFNRSGNYDPLEIQANAFATQLLTPPWLVASHMQRQGWTRDDLRNPIIVYQLSLRMGSSYAATCHALRDSKGISVSTRDRLLAVQPRSIKQGIAGNYRPVTWHRDVWLVTDRDKGMVLEGSKNDSVVLKLREHSSSGYLWEFGTLSSAGLAIKLDERQAVGHGEQIGGVTFRIVTAEPADGEGATGHVDLRETRPWAKEGRPLNSLTLDVQLSGPIPVGLLPAQRAVLLGAA